MTDPEMVFTVAAGAATDRGRRRQANEDGYLADAPVFLVADGMGGHVGGAAASGAVVAAFADSISGEWVTTGALDEAVASAARNVAALPASERSAPGSTVTGVGLAEQNGTPCWLVFNVGDSRTYRLSDGQLEQVTIDHSLVQQLLDHGAIDATEARSHDERNVITRALGAGMSTRPAVDQWLLVAEPGDRMLICSDGLHGELTDQLIAATLLTEPDPVAAAESLVAAAVEAGGRDNVTVIVVDAIDVVAVPHDPAVFDTEDSLDLDGPTVPRAMREPEPLAGSE